MFRERGRSLREAKLPLSVVREILAMQNEHYDRLAQMMAEHLEKTAALYERALNPPQLQAVPVAPLTNDWRMSEEEEDAKYQLDNKLMTREQYDKVLRDIAEAQTTGFDLSD